MKKNRLLLLVSLTAAMPNIAAQDVEDLVGNEQEVTKQQLEQFLAERPTEKVDESVEEQDESDDSLAIAMADDADETDVEPEVTQEKAVADEQPTEIELPETPEPFGPPASVTQEKKEQEAPEPAAVSQADDQSATQVTTKESKPVESEAKPVEDAQSTSEQKPEASATPTETPKSEEPVQKSLAQPQVTAAKEVPAPETKPAQAPVATSAPAAQAQESLLDTIDIEEGGNWVLKRKALQDTVRKIEDINALYDDIRDTNIVFLQGINTVDVLFTQFSYDVGLDLGKVDQLVQDVLHHLESEREETGDLSEAERDILQKAEDRKKEVEQLRTNIHDIWQAYAQLKEARMLNDEQIIEADRIRKQAWRNFRMIERVLNEVKAEELYHETVQLFEALQTSYRYLQTRLIPHFEQSIKTIQEKMQMAKKQSEELQSQGVLLKEEAIIVDKLEKDQSVDQDQMQAPAPTGWLTRIKNVLLSPFHALGSLWGWITGSSSDMRKYLPEEQELSENHESKQPEEL
ncbi:MAG: hypothetical protein AB7F19_06160 [Candidatus Babeliales bacterium]